MKLSNYESDGLEQVDRWLQLQQGLVDMDTLREVLKTCNLTFVLEEINRWQSTMLCELKDSYVQQSQRYVTMAADGYCLPQLELEDLHRAEALIAQALELYGAMSVLKAESKGRPKPEHYLHGIPVEDARYILPLAMKTNLSVAMSGDKLLDWFALLQHIEYARLFAEIKAALLECLPTALGAALAQGKYSYPQPQLVQACYQQELNQITPEEPVIYLHGAEKPELKAGLGALTSTKEQPPSVVLAQWGEEWPHKAAGVTNRVLGYGHTSIAEQARTTFGMMCSLVTYHQQVRHRLPSTYRESWSSLLEDRQRPFILPPRIAGSAFREQYLQLAEQFCQFQRELATRYSDNRWMYFLLNCQQIKIITSTNARMDCGMLRERICLNAQWEIRTLAEQKLAKLRERSQVLYRLAVPDCVYGVCKEGKLSCGQAGKMREKYGEG